MSTISNTQSKPALDLRAHTPIDTRKVGSKHKNPLTSANQNPLTRANPIEDSNKAAIAKARMAAEGLVATTFIEPILKQVRESNNTPPPFGPSSAEKQFSSLLDTKLADKIVHAANFPLVERITAQLLRNMPDANLPDQKIDTKG